MSWQCDITVNEEFSVSSVGCYFPLSSLLPSAAALGKGHLSASCRRRLQNLCNTIKPVVSRNLLPLHPLPPRTNDIHSFTFDFKAHTCSVRPSRAFFFFFNVFYQAGWVGVFLLMGCCAKRNKVKFHLCGLSGPLTVSWRCTTAIKILGEVFT